MRRPGEPEVTRDRAEEFFGAVSKVTPRKLRTVGVGNYYVLSGAAVTGGRLEQNVDGVDRVIHLTAFPRFTPVR